MKHSRTDLKDIFRGLQDQMEARLTLNRHVVRHPGAKGAATELEWVNMLSTYLPRRYSADKAFVMDATGRLSDEIDIVIYDRQYSPFILRQNGVTYIPAECVYAVIEVKQTLSKKNVMYAQEKAESVRKLGRTSVPVPHAGGTFDAKEPARIIAGIVALDGSLGKAAMTTLRGCSEKKLLNLGCSLRGKTFFRTDGVHPWQVAKTPHDVIEVSDENSLVDFFMSLLTELQRVGTVAAMDIGAYLK